MALRVVKPFDDKQWSQLQEDMKQGASQDQINNIENARIRIQKIRKENF